MLLNSRNTLENWTGDKEMMPSSGKHFQNLRNDCVQNIGVQNIGVPIVHHQPLWQGKKKKKGKKVHTPPGSSHEKRVRNNNRTPKSRRGAHWGWAVGQSASQTRPTNSQFPTGDPHLNYARVLARSGAPHFHPRARSAAPHFSLCRGTYLPKCGVSMYCRGHST